MNGPGAKISMAVWLPPAIALTFLIGLHRQAANPQPTAPDQQPPFHSVRDGIYSEKQADRGQALYREKCSSCHGDQLAGKEGDDDVPALAGHDFSVAWNGQTVGDLYRKILRKMPQDSPGSLTPQQSIDLVAFLLRFNKFPSGKGDLAPDNESLNGIRFEARKPDQASTSSQTPQ